MNITSSFLHDGGSLINGVGNTLFAPLMLILYKLLVVWPNQIIFWFLSLIQKITGFDNNGLNLGSNVVYGSDSPFLKIFGAFVLFGLIIGAFCFCIAIFRVYLNGTKDRKQEFFNIAKRSAYGVIITACLPVLFFVVSMLINTLFSSMFSKILDVASNNINNSSFKLIMDNLVTKVPDPHNQNVMIVSDNVYIQMNKLFVFNTWTLGFSGDIIKDNKLNPDLLPVANSIKNLSSFAWRNDGLDLLANSSLSQWNVLLSGIASIIFLFGIITFIISVIVKLLWVYILMFLAPLIMGGGVLVEKNTSKFVVDFVQKLIIVQICVIGYFLFSMIYTLIIGSLANTISNNITMRILQFAVLFAGIALINQIPTAMIKYFNSNEQLIGNEINESKQAFNTVARPLQTAFTSVITGAVANARNLSRSTSSSLSDFKSAPTSLR